MARKTQQRTVTFKEVPFSELIERDQRLAKLRREHANETAEERRAAADWAYHATSASHLFNQLLSLAGQESPFPEQWPDGIAALAIDPTYAPAMLTVGSMEYQLGRIDEAVALFQGLVRLPADTEDLEVIIDKAGDFLLDQENFERASELYAAASARFPASTRLLGGVGYCLAKLNRFEESIAVQRRALAVDPDNYRLLNDLGWALTESGQYQEAEAVLQKAADRSPPDYDLARNNLNEARRLKRAAG